MLPQEDRPTAIFCCSDRIAAATIRGILDAGYQVPRDISIVGFDDLRIPDSDYNGPRITSIHQPLYEMGVESVHAIGDILSASGQGLTKRVFSTVLAEHDTVCRLT